MRVVIDTNIFLSACLSAGAANKVLEVCLEGKCLPLLGAALFTEYEDILTRTELFKSSLLNHEEREELLDIFLASCEWIKVYYLWRPNLPDEGDNHLIELAVAGAADYIVTRNLRDISGGELSFPQLKIVSPETFLKEI